LDEKLDQDPDYLSLKEQQERHFQALRDQLTKAEQPLVGALNDAGISVKSIGDLVNTKQSYPGAIPILIEHLRHSYPFRIREGIAHAK
jgi:hypothetical protein